jgi:hypothetical protein
LFIPEVTKSTIIAERKNTGFILLFLLCNNMVFFKLLF